MKILHYSLGFPPYRSGGLTKFCMDLMREQIKEGHEVSLLWPGEMSLFSNTVKIKAGGKNDGISSFEVINPLPVSYDEGIKDFGEFVKEGQKSVYDEFLAEFKPDVIHVHTLMGLHKNLLVSAKEQGIRLVFTTHDFFPICPKVTMYRKGQICSSIESCEECGVCNNTALGLKKIQILQSPAYRASKDSALVKKMRKQHRDGYLVEDTSRDENGSVGTPADYKNLRNFYYSMLSLMDIIHYNSTVTKKAYEKVFNLENSVIIPITHSDISDNRHTKEFNGDKLRIRYLGAQSSAKGYPVLKDALDKLWKERQDFCLDIHFEPQERSEYMNSHERYSYSELGRIFEETDILIAPSIWYETFGFTVLEALSFGVPVIISDTVGAKDILTKGAGIVIEDINSDKIAEALKTVNKVKLSSMNEVIVKAQDILTIDKMNEAIIRKCYEEA
ncbi:MAG: glycosyltransferase [Saccharofermentans sp.]|nr:glycosyltransferase [Saccharofermentans sp.]